MAIKSVVCIVIAPNDNQALPQLKKVVNELLRDGHMWRVVQVFLNAVLGLSLRTGFCTGFEFFVTVSKILDIFDNRVGESLQISSIISQNGDVFWMGGKISKRLKLLAPIV